MGRPRKLPMVKREEAVARAVTFSKRRHGLMSKTSELCISGKSRVAAIVQSPRCTNKTYSFGFPSTASVFNSFLTGSVPAATHVEEEARKEMACLLEENKKLQIEVDGLKEKKDEQFASGITSFLMSRPSPDQLVLCYERIKDLIGKAENKMHLLSSTDSPSPSPAPDVSSSSGDTTWNPYNTFAAGNTSSYNNGSFPATNTFDNRTTFHPFLSSSDSWNALPTFVDHADVTGYVGGETSFLYNDGATPDFSLNVGTPSNYQCNFVTPQPQLPNLGYQFYPNYGAKPDFSLNVGTPSNYQCSCVMPQPQLPNPGYQFYPNY